MKTSAKTFPYTKPASEPSVWTAFPKGGVVTLFAQVLEIDEGWARRVRLQMRSSIGALSIEASFDQLPDRLAVGDWVRVRALRRHSEGETPLKLIGLVPAFPDCKVAWLPVELYHRKAHMQRLRRLLDALDPAWQLVFMLALADAQVQRCFFWRVAAADHHGYPGGLFDQSVEAAEYAWLRTAAEPDARMRGLAAIAALLFDLGKTADECLAPDAPRADHSQLAAHPLTAGRLELALERARRVVPDRIGELEAVLFAPQVALSMELQRAARLAREAVHVSWQRSPPP